MKQYKEITIKNFSEIENIIEFVKKQHAETKRNFMRGFFLVGLDAIRKFENEYGKFSRDTWTYEESRMYYFEIQGKASFVYVGYVTVMCGSSDNEEVQVQAQYITKVISYKDILLTASGGTGLLFDKKFKLNFFNEKDKIVPDLQIIAPTELVVLTDKKADAWLNYLYEKKEKSNIILKERKEKVDTFKKKLSFLTGKDISTFEGSLGVLPLGLFALIWEAEEITGKTSYQMDLNFENIREEVIFAELKDKRMLG